MTGSISATAGALAPHEGATTTFTPLIRTSGQAAAIPADKIRLYPDPLALLRDFKPGDQALVLAARVSGPLQSAFGDTAPQDVAKEPAHLSEAKEPAQIIVVADTDLLDDRNWLSMVGQGVAVPLADNAALVANALDYLVGSDALMGLRGREVTVRPFTQVAEIRRASEAQYRAKEQELLQRLDELQGKLSSLRVADGEDTSLLSDAQRKEIDGFRSQLLDTRRELRDVQLALRQDIERPARPDPLPQHRRRAPPDRRGGGGDGARPPGPLSPPVRPGPGLIREEARHVAQELRHPRRSPRSRAWRSPSTPWPGGTYPSSPRPTARPCFRACSTGSTRSAWSGSPAPRGS